MARPKPTFSEVVFSGEVIVYLMSSPFLFKGGKFLPLNTLQTTLRVVNYNVHNNGQFPIMDK